jgi:hypothetical protein
MKLIVFTVTLFLNFFNISHAQWFEALKPLKIQNEISYISKSTKNSVVSKQPSIPNVRIDTTLVQNSEAKSDGNALFSVYKTLIIQPSKGKVSLIFETKRIIDKKGPLDVDTDVPFANDRTNKSALDRYLSKLNVPNKFILEKNNFEINTELKGNYGGLPPLHPIHKLSGIFINFDGVLYKDKDWIDTLFNNSGTFINSYKVTSVDAANATISFNGKMKNNSNLKLERSKEEEAEVFEKMKQGAAAITAKTLLDRVEYVGVLTVNLETQLINEMKFTLSKDQTLSVLSQQTSKSYEMSYTVTNKILK